MIGKLLGSSLAIAVLGLMPAQPALGATATSKPLAAGSVVQILGVPTTSGAAWSGDISWVDGKGTYNPGFSAGYTLSFS